MRKRIHNIGGKILWEDEAVKIEIQKTQEQMIEKFQQKLMRELRRGEEIGMELEKEEQQKKVDVLKKEIVDNIIYDFPVGFQSDRTNNLLKLVDKIFEIKAKKDE